MKKLFLLYFLLPVFCFSQSIQLKKNGSGLKLSKASGIAVIANAGGNGQLANSNGLFNYNVPSLPYRSSAGVYNQDGVLVRTLWGNKTETQAGTVTGQWDGYLDGDTALAAYGNYTVKILTNNVQYKWGIIGNSSKYINRNQFLNYGGIQGIAFASNRGFVGYGFYEGGSDDTNHMFFSNDSIQVANNITGIPGAIVCDLATDGVNVYHAMADQYSYGIPHMNYIYATKASDNSIINFSAGISHQTGRDQTTYSGLIGFKADGDIQYSGIAVNGNFIFATRKDENKLYVFNKTTGSQVQALTFTAPSRLAAGNNNELWLINNGSIQKFTVNASTGALSAATLTLSVTTPVSVAISPDNTTVLIADAGNHQLKAFSNSTGTALWTLGQAGGYVTNGPAVANDKFMFDHTYYSQPALAYQSDGSFWANDPGNYRLMHFNVDRTFKERICYVPSCRSINVDPNNPNRVFADELEFYRDYTKPPDNTGANGSWYLKSNWKVGTEVLDVYEKFNAIETFPNGHTYGFDPKSTTVYDLQAIGAVMVGNRPTYSTVQPDGSLEFRNILNNGSNVQIVNSALTGYNTSFMPQWATPAQQVYHVADLPIDYDNNTRGSSTNTNKYFFFQPDSYPGYHFAAVSKLGGNKTLWQTSMTTPGDYTGAYPKNGYFQLSGNSHPCLANVLGTNVFWHVTGELGYQTELCRTNHYNEDGLVIGHFGNDKQIAGLTGNSDFLAGNSFSTTAFNVGNRIFYDYCDEGVHGAIHEVECTNLNTIQAQTVTLTVSAPVTKIIDPTDLMGGLPYKSSNQLLIATTANKWTIETQVNQAAIYTNVGQYLKDSVDIYCKAYNGAQTISRYLNNTNLSNWELSGQIAISGQSEGGSRINRFDLVDVNGKVIIRIEEKYQKIYLNEGYNNNDNYFLPNDIENLARLFNPIRFNYNGGNLSFNYLGKTQTITTAFENGALLNAPGKIRIYQVSNGVDRVIDLYGFKFIPGSAFAP